MSVTGTHQEVVRKALARLGIERFVLSIHQASFPPSSDDIGYGTPCSSRSTQFLQWVARLGFSGVALGPAGITGRTNPSPYDATGLSRNPLHISLGALVEHGLLDPHLLDTAVANRPPGDLVQYDYAWGTQRRLLAAVSDSIRDDAGMLKRLGRFRKAHAWADVEAWYEAVAAAVGHEDWRRWPASPREQREVFDRFLVSQLLAFEQHTLFRDRCHRQGLRLCGDLPIGTSHRDRFLFRDLFLSGYAMGAPPSRTNPEGQPWGYPLLDPDKLDPGGDAWRYAAMRLDTLLQDHDSLRIDHPHGWVCPWVYRTDDPDPLHAVQNGARLFESPDLPDHPTLAAFARVRPDQIDHACPRHADHWVRDIESDQVERYAQLFDLIVHRIAAQGGDPRDSMVEVLSTCPRPLYEVLQRHQLGRYRVTQKAVLDDSQDVYRSDRAHPEDWIMVGNHDTPPLRIVIERWQQRGELSGRAAYLANRLAGNAGEVDRLRKRLALDPNALATAMFADLFCGPARNVLVFWPDLFGLREVYNRPGVVDQTNWSLRVQADFERAYRDARHRKEAPDLAQALAWALHARGLDCDAEGRKVVDALQKQGAF